MSVAPWPLVGDPRPTSRCRARAGADYSLADSAASRCVIVFYPGDDTPVCTKQLNTYNDDIATFDDGGRAARGHLAAVGRQPRVASPAKHGFTFPLLADVDKKVAGPYGTLGPLGFPRRSVFVVDGDGVVRYAHRAIAGLTFRPTDELVRAVNAASVEGFGRVAVQVGAAVWVGAAVGPANRRRFAGCAAQIPAPCDQNVRPVNVSVTWVRRIVRRIATESAHRGTAESPPNRRTEASPDRHRIGGRARLRSPAMPHEVRAVVAAAAKAPVTVETIMVPDPGPGEALVPRPGLRRLPHRPALPRGRHQRRLPVPARPRGGRRRRGRRRRRHQRGARATSWCSPGGRRAARCRSCRRGRPWYCFDSPNATQKMTPRRHAAVARRSASAPSPRRRSWPPASA